MRTIILESQSRDLNVKISLKYFQRDGTFKRQLSKRAQAVFGRRIEQLISNPSRLFVIKIMMHELLYQLRK